MERSEILKAIEEQVNKELVSVKSTVIDGVESIKKTYEEFKKTNDERLETLEKARGVSEVVEKLERIEVEMDKKEKKIDDLTLAINRFGDTVEAMN